MSAPHVLCVDLTTPADRAGTPVILLRHLARLARDGWHVSAAAPDHEMAAFPLPDGWASLPLPYRRAGWPPVRDAVPASAALRRWLLGRDLAARVRTAPPDVVLTVLTPQQSAVAAHAAHALRCPLAVVLHDQPELWEGTPPAQQQAVRSRVDRVLAQAARVFPVTPALAAAYGPAVAAKADVLLPIPEGGAATAAWRDAYARPHLVLSGSLHPFQRPALDALARALAAVGGRLTVVTHHDLAPFADLAEAHDNLWFRPAFESAAEARAFCAAEASAVLVSYAFDAQPWAATSFPSKLAEFVHLGLPVLVLAPPHAAASAWARANDWTALAETLDAEALAAEVGALATPDGWARRAADAHRAARGPFDPETIHAGFEASLLALTDAA